MTNATHLVSKTLRASCPTRRKVQNLLAHALPKDPIGDAVARSVAHRQLPAGIGTAFAAPLPGPRDLRPARRQLDCHGADLDAHPYQWDWACLHRRHAWTFKANP